MTIGSVQELFEDENAVSADSDSEEKLETTSSKDSSDDDVISDKTCSEEKTDESMVQDQDQALKAEKSESSELEEKSLIDRLQEKVVEQTKRQTNVDNNILSQYITAHKKKLQGSILGRGSWYGNFVWGG